MSLLKKTPLKGSPVASNIAAHSSNLHRALEIRWWNWRKLFLEAKRLQVQKRRQEGA